MTEKNSTQDRAQRLTQALLDRGAAEDQQAVEDVLKAVSEPPKKIPEPVFRELFLPFFLGEKTAAAEENILAHWIGLVGSATYPADVVDVKGETVFQVPPMYDSSRLNISKNERGVESFTAIVKNYQDENSKTPVAGQNYLAHALSKKLKSNMPDGVQSNYSWEPALRYYGLIKDSQTTGGAVDGEADMSDFKFDD